MNKEAQVFMFFCIFFNHYFSESMEYKAFKFAGYLCLIHLFIKNKNVNFSQILNFITKIGFSETFDKTDAPKFLDDESCFYFNKIKNEYCEMKESRDKSKFVEIMSSQKNLFMHVLISCTKYISNYIGIDMSYFYYFDS